MASEKVSNRSKNGLLGASDDAFEVGACQEKVVPFIFCSISADKGPHRKIPFIFPLSDAPPAPASDPDSDVNVRDGGRRTVLRHGSGAGNRSTAEPCADARCAGRSR